MRDIVVSYIIDDEHMTDEQYENQEDKQVKISISDLHDVLTYGRFNHQVKLTSSQTISEITNVELL